MTILIEIENKKNSNESHIHYPHQYAIALSMTKPQQPKIPDVKREPNFQSKVYLSRVSFKEINALNGLDYMNDFLSQICNYCNKTIKNEVRNDYRTILICGHHYHTECICKCSTENINIVRCINCFEKMDKIKEIVKYTYSTYDVNSDTIGHIVNDNISKNYPLLYKRKFEE